MRRIKKHHFIFIISILTILNSCSDNNSASEDYNEIPIIELLTPIDVTEIIIGATLNIRVNITDNDGSISEAKLLVNNNEIDATSSTPYVFTWNTTTENEGDYSLKIIAIDNDGNSSSIEKQVMLRNVFTCGNDFFDPRDGSIYRTSQIGSQCWMAQNLNFQTEEESWNYLNQEVNGEIYGKLYSRETALIVSPNGWHLPSDEEWKILEGTVDSQYMIGDIEWDGTTYRGFDSGKNLKSESGWNSNGNGTDLYGFNALPGGYRTGGAIIEENNFENLGFSAPYWTSTSAGTDLLYTRELFASKDTSFRSFENSWALAVRCIKD
ncbi:FISUMP domain-containing protein [Ulvibacter litoralis]|uniref:Major paralogous domain-containing protein n=1 Tax=Ulvibacter litoralis TaxID=227084 RepID=A0A1G7JMW8_9FLAO|nr:FISUMP domain-containing protein [Ulvibacter litoralis]GHC65450.1 hypothetical protein GCM10008083_33320 [Ulvibacter litoralis]SDF26134.1 major paralogous domain-containing protein [Ulvibacter litoralis]